jgi:hypothetical protein
MSRTHWIAGLTVAAALAGTLAGLPRTAADEGEEGTAREAAASLEKLASELNVFAVRFEGYADGKGDSISRGYATQVSTFARRATTISEVLSHAEGRTSQIPVPEGRLESNEAAAIGALRTLTTAQSLFREGDEDKNGVLDYASSLKILGKVGVIDRVLASGKKQGYVFKILEASQFTWSATAEPATPGASGKRSFFVDESGVIRFSTSGAASSLSSPIGG